MTMFSVLLPVGLMMGKALVDIFIEDENNLVRQIFDTLGRPLMALLIAVIVGIFTLGRGAGMTRDQITKCIEGSLPPVAGIILIVAAGGGFKQVLIDTGIGTKLAEWATARQHFGHPAGLGAGGADPARDRLGDGRHHHRVLVDAGAGRGHEHR